MSPLDELLTEALPKVLPECNYVTLVKRTQNGSSEPHVLPMSSVDTWEKLFLFSQRIFDTDTPPRIFTENNCPIPAGFWGDTLRGAGRSGQCFYLEIYQEQYTKCKNRSHLPHKELLPDAVPPLEDINLVIFVEFPAGLFSRPPDDVIVEPISPHLLFETLAHNMKYSLSREFSPNAEFSVVFENAKHCPLSPKMTIAECGLSHGALVHCKLEHLNLPQGQDQDSTCLEKP